MCLLLWMWTNESEIQKEIYFTIFILHIHFPTCYWCRVSSLVICRGMVPSAIIHYVLGTDSIILYFFSLHRSRFFFSLLFLHHLLRFPIPSSKLCPCHFDESKGKKARKEWYKWRYEQQVTQPTFALSKWMVVDTVAAKQNICRILFLCDITDSETEGRRLVNCS